MENHTATPWKVSYHWDSHYNVYYKLDHDVPHNDNPEIKQQHHDQADQLAAAVNNTVGQGINPEAVPDMKEALQFVLSDLNSTLDYECSMILRAALSKAKEGK